MKLYDTNPRSCLLGWFEGGMLDLTSSDEITKSFPKAKKTVSVGNGYRKSGAGYRRKVRRN
jgi:hypothetical protein